MGLLEPLVSQALGRSPYDEVVPGEGPPDHPVNGYVQQYDERGRPVNPETKRINKDVIRSHNEVMTVIGVAEPDNGGIEAQAEAAIRHHRRDDAIGRRLVLAAGILETSCIWGINGIRQRILLYQEYSNVSFYNMCKLAKTEQSSTAFFLGGLPSFMVSTLIDQWSNLIEPEDYPRCTALIGRLGSWIRLHLAIYTFFQRTGIIPCSQLLPSWRFFIPGTSISPIAIPPLPTTLAPKNIWQWLGACCLASAPFAGLYIYTKVYSVVTRFFRISIYKRLPRPKPLSPKRKALRDITPIAHPIAEAIEIPVEEVVEEMQGTRTDPTPSPAPPENDTIVIDNTNPAPRRHSTVSLRGTGPALPIVADDFGSDDEEGEVSATLISFDVEATESTVENGASGSNQNTPGAWSAELRPNMLDISRSAALAGRGPVYRDNALTRLPAALATDVLTLAPVRLLMTPIAAWAWLKLSREYMTRMGMSLAGVHGPEIWGIFTRQGCFNLLSTEGLLLLGLGEAWGVIVAFAWGYLMTEEEWNELEGLEVE
ncbi:hypothetical protein QBC43DRAFT_308680 [Cladorrhinum sp. PSN259]|nr:hypothetical protein QBC43DRAFT_308680 [Cladorrhinum sp. PSN259]